MTLLKRVAKNAAFLGVATGLTRGARLVIVWYVGRYMGSAVLGEYGTVMAFAAMFQAFAVQSLSQLVMRDVAQAEHDVGSYFSSVTMISLALSVGLVLVMDISASALQYPRSTLYGIAVMGIAIVPATVERVLEAMIKAIDRTEYVALGSLIWTLVVTSLGIVMASRGAGLQAVFWIFVVGEVVLALGYFVLAGRLFGRIRFRPDWAFCRRLFGSVGVFFFISMFNRGLRRLDVVILSKLCDATAVGLYTAAFKLVEVFIAMQPAFVQAMFPSMARSSENTSGDSSWMTEKATKFFVVMLLAVALCLSIGAREIIFALYGASEFDQSVALLRVLAWSLAPYYAFGILGSAIVVRHREKVALRIAGVNLALSLFLNFLLVPSYGPLGVAVAMVSAATVGVIQYTVFIRRHLFALDLMGTFAKPGFAAAVAGGLAILLRDWNTYAVGVAACGAYLLLIMVTRTFSRNEMAVSRRLVAQIRLGRRPGE